MDILNRPCYTETKTCKGCDRMAKKAVLISCFHYYERRICPIEDFFSSKGYDYLYITADFDHVSKKPFQVFDEGCIQIATRPYRKNLSPERLLSHWQFARDTFQRIEAYNPDVIYMIVPPNSLCRFAAKYKKKHPQVKLIYDLYDLWPETFPSGKAQKVLAAPFAVWRHARDCGLPAADLILTECQLYQQRLKKQLRGLHTGLLPLCAPWPAPEDPVTTWKKDEIRLCYLGSINSIIDIDGIAWLIAELQKYKRVTLDIIGGGETLEVLVEKTRAAGAAVVEHGAIYDQRQKQAILDTCDFGLNIMKRSVCVGLTMKSADYFAGGLPVISNIPADTQQWITEYGAGIHIRNENDAQAVQEILHLTEDEHTAMRAGAAKLHRAQFSRPAFMRRLEQQLGSLLNR